MTIGFWNNCFESYVWFENECFENQVWDLKWVIWKYMYDLLIWKMYLEMFCKSFESDLKRDTSVCCVKSVKDCVWSELNVRNEWSTWLSVLKMFRDHDRYCLEKCNECLMWKQWGYVNMFVKCHVWGPPLYAFRNQVPHTVTIVLYVICEWLIWSDATFDVYAMSLLLF